MAKLCHINIYGIFLSKYYKICGESFVKQGMKLKIVLLSLKKEMRKKNQIKISQEDKMAKKIILFGDVQGVFCREYCRKNAKKLGLKGSASNLIDGTVAVILDTNDDQKVKSFITALKGNPYSFSFFGHIDDITIKDYSGSISGDYQF